MVSFEFISGIYSKLFQECLQYPLVICSQNLNKIVHNTIFKKHITVQSHIYSNLVSIAWKKNFSSSLDNQIIILKPELQRVVKLYFQHFNHIFLPTYPSRKKIKSLIANLIICYWMDVCVPSNLYVEALAV